LAIHKWVRDRARSLMCDSYETVLGSVWQDTSPSREKQRQELGLLSLPIFQACLLVSLAQGTRKKEGKGRIRMYRRREVHTHTGYIR
jgi:hypothetical protein